MAQRIVSIITITFYLLVFALPILGLAIFGGLDTNLTPSDVAAVKFTVKQAFWSAIVSILVAIPVSRALARRQFMGRAVLISVLSAPFILPVIVAISGVLFIFGRDGVVNQILGAVSLNSVSIYGLTGILLVHVFFNLPLAIRVLLFGWGAIPVEHHRIIRGLNLSPWARFKVIELPMLISRVPSVAAIIFVICLSSFAVALLIGGGPRATTVELAIYQAFRFDFDLAKAGQLAIIQSCFAAVAILISLLASKRLQVGPSYIINGITVSSRRAFFIDYGLIFAVSLFMLGPIIAVILRGLPYLPTLPMLFMAHRIGDSISMLALSISPLVLAVGLFVLLRPFVNPFDITLLIVIVLNAVLAVPFVLRLVLPEIEKTKTDFQQLFRSLGMSDWSIWFWVLLPRLLRPLGFAFGLTMALSLGDLGVIVLLGSPETATLPYQIMQLRTGYRLDAAAGASVLLLVMCLASLVCFDGLGRRYARN
jgi:thiamine transport system permease protein